MQIESGKTQYKGNNLGKILSSTAPRQKQLKDKMATWFYKYVKNEMQIPQSQDEQTNECLTPTLKTKHIPNLNILQTRQTKKKKRQNLTEEAWKKAKTSN